MQNTEQIDEVLNRTFDDRKISRGEKLVLSQLIDDLGDELLEKRAQIRNRIFFLAKNSVGSTKDREILDWVEDMLRILDKPLMDQVPGSNECSAHFSPGDDCLLRITGLLRATKKSLDICVFTITDDRVCREIIDAKRRGVRIRIITDDDKRLDIGSDIDDLCEAGIPITQDRAPSHMHHKFAIFDRRTLLTGSYNWTRSAASSNHENLIVTGEQQLVSAFEREFEFLWESLAEYRLRR